MQIIVLGTIFPSNKSVEMFLQNSNGGIPSTGSEVQLSIIRGMESLCDKPIKVINAEPIGTWPKHYKKILLRSKKEKISKNIIVNTVGCINFPLIKQIYRYVKTYKILRHYIKQCNPKEKINILMYHFYKPHMKAALKAKKYGNVDLNIIVPDLPNEYGIGYNKTNLISKIIHKLAGEYDFKLAKKMDKYILFTKYMRNPLELGTKPYIVMEGICSNRYFIKYVDYASSNRITFLYSGNLSAECGINELLDVFSKIEDENIVLNIYGFGSGVDLCKQYAQKYKNIVYHDPVTAEELCKAQQQSTYLINPRKNTGKVIKYFFPSKTFGYMASGRPMIGYWLDCFPEEYRNMFYIVNPNDLNGLEKAIRKAILIPEAERNEMGKRAKDFIEKEKNEIAQAKKVYEFITNN